MTAMDKKIKSHSVSFRGFSRGFTLTELIVTVVIVSMIAVFAIPNYQKTVLKARERNAILNLMTIHGANEIYKARSGSYLPGVGLNLAGINSGLVINIVDTDMTYSYSAGADPSTYTVTAAWTSAGSFTGRINQAPVTGTNPCCSAGSCPSLPGCS